MFKINFDYQSYMFIFVILQNAMLKYSASHAKKWDFAALHLYCTKVNSIAIRV